MTDGEWEIRGPDGTEYELNDSEPTPVCETTQGNTWIRIRPKRKQEPYHELRCKCGAVLVKTYLTGTFNGTMTLVFDDGVEVKT